MDVMLQIHHDLNSIKFMLVCILIILWCIATYLRWIYKDLRK